MNDSTREAMQAAPSIGAIVIYLTDRDINWWAAFAGIVFIVVQVLYMLWRWHRDWRREKAGRKPVDTAAGGL